MSNGIKEVIDSDYDNVLKLIKSGAIEEEDNFILSTNKLYTVAEIAGNEVVLHVGSMSTTEFLINIKILVSDGIEYIMLIYKNQNKVIIWYKDIPYTTNYYSSIDNWLKFNMKYVNNYFTNIIDEKLLEAINGIKLDSSNIIATVDKYNLPFSRDLMLTKAIEKYSSEMATLLSAIANPDLKTGFSKMVDAMRTLVTGKPEDLTTKTIDETKSESKLDLTKEVVNKKKRVTPKK